MVSLIDSLAKNYKLPIQVVRARWKMVKSRHSSDNRVDYYAALMAFDSMRNDPLTKTSRTSPPVSMRRERLREMVPKRERR